MLREAFARWTGLDAEALAHGGWEFVPLHVGPELAAAAALRGTEIHFASAPEWRARLITRRRTRDFLAPLFERYGFLTTRCQALDFAQIAFITRLGFELTFEDPLSGIHHYMLSALPFGKEI